jgi:hypothetical protein
MKRKRDEINETCEISDTNEVEFITLKEYSLIVGIKNPRIKIQSNFFFNFYTFL